jgi:hypothetical protein
VVVAVLLVVVGPVGPTTTNSTVYYSGVTLFNSLPFSIKEVAHNTTKFKHELKKFLLKNPFYSVEEYMNKDAS